MGIKKRGSQASPTSHPGSSGRTRTYNQPVNSRPLCQLSYRGTSASDIIPLSGEIVKFTWFPLRPVSLEDTTDWVFHVLHENTDDEQDRSDLRGTVEDCISGWPCLAGRVSGAVDALALT